MNIKLTGILLRRLFAHILIKDVKGFTLTSLVWNFIGYYSSLFFNRFDSAKVPHTQYGLEYAKKMSSELGRALRQDIISKPLKFVR